MENGELEARKFYDTMARQKVQIHARVKNLDNIIRFLYGDRVCGRITPERYDNMANDYEQERVELKVGIYHRSNQRDESSEIVCQGIHGERQGIL